MVAFGGSDRLCVNLTGKHRHTGSAVLKASDLLAGASLAVISSNRGVPGRLTGKLALKCSKIALCYELDH